MEETDFVFYPNLKKICRLCLKEATSVLNIFESELSIPLRIMACTNLEVKESDNLPTNICNVCRLELEKFYLFRKKCQCADLKLRKHIRQINYGKISKVFSTKDDDNGSEEYDDDCYISEKFIEHYQEEQNRSQKKVEKSENISKLNKFTQTEIKNKIDSSCEQNLEDNEIIYFVKMDCSDEGSEKEFHLKEYVDEEKSVLSTNTSEEIVENDIIEENCNDDFIDIIEDSSVGNNEQSNEFHTTNVDDFHINTNKEDLHDANYKIDIHNINITNVTKNVKLFKCHLCPQSFSRLFLLEKHLTLHKKNKNYICTVCRKLFAAKSSLDRHSRIHNGERPFKCNICGKAFIQNEILKRHQYLHFDKKPFACNHCDQTFTQKNLLQHHITIKHTNKPVPKLFSCDICPKAFVHSSGLSRHVILHSGIKYICEICKKSFTDKSALKRHKEIHYKVKS